MRTDIASSIIYLKNKVHKWRNISFFFIIFSLVITLKFLFGNSSNNINVDTISPYIAEIKINNPIFEDAHRSKILTKIESQDNIKAVILNVSSPGGGIVGSEILYNDLRKIANKKPLIILMGSIAASGAYMASLASDYIIAHNGTLTGSIGVMMQAPNINELSKKIGFEVKNYKSSSVKGYPSLTEEFILQNDAIIQDSIDDSHKFFTELVIKRRLNKIKEKHHKIIFDGRVFNGRQALKYGLIDKIGFREDAINYLISLDKKFQDLPIKEVTINKKEQKLLKKFTNLLPFFDINFSSASFSNSQIMAISN
ncbi:MAG: signal peptide peptidase SppA [Rickettsiales bacterium]|nr:signal peptide peptidase SppA [Rickettsiales bacterium]